jgi:LacI family transcriptional regulator
MDRATQADVARDAGVSQTTVSFVLNGKVSESISAETTERVLQSVQRLKYVPDMAARTMASKAGGRRSSDMIGVLIPQTEPGKEFMFSNPFYGDFLSAVEYTARVNGYHVLISGTNANQSYLEIAKSRSLSGIIILGMLPSTDLKEYTQSRIPTVLVDCYENSHYFHTVGINDRYGGFLAAQYLIEHGHKQIAFISGAVTETGVSQMRLLGYKDALSEAELEYNERFVFSGDVLYDYAVAAARKIAETGVTAVFASADILALGLLEGFQQAGIRVPDDISLIGFDDLYLTRSCSPALTTVHQDITEKGRVAAEIIIDASKVHKLPKRNITIPISITERKSVRTI